MVVWREKSERRIVVKRNESVMVRVMVVRDVVEDGEVSFLLLWCGDGDEEGLE